MEIKINCNLNKFEKIILEYLLEIFNFSKKRSIKIPVYVIKKDMNIIPDLMSYIGSLASKKIEYIKSEDEIYYFDIIEHYSIVRHYMYFTFSKEVYNIINDENTIFQIYSLMFRNKYSLKFLEEILKHETLVITDQELRILLNIEDGYTRSYDFENKILKQIIKEINSYLKIEILISKELIKNDATNTMYTLSLNKSNLELVNNFKKSYREIVKILNKTDDLNIISNKI